MTEGQYHLLNVLRWLTRRLMDGEDDPWNPDRPVNLERIENLADRILKVTRRVAEPETDPGEAAVYFDAFSLAGKVKLLNRDLGEAESLLQEGLEFAEVAKHPPLKLSVAELKQNLGTVYDLQNRETEALEMFLDALDVMKRTDPLPHETVANLANNIGLIYRNQKDFEAAEEHYLQALEEFTEMADHPLEMALVCNNLGTLYWAAGEMEAAKTYHLKALDLRKKHLENSHPDIAQSASNLAVVYHQCGDVDSAHALYEEAIKDLKKLAESDPELFDVVTQNYAALLEDNGDPRKAAKLLGSAQKLLSKSGERKKV